MIPDTDMTMDQVIEKIRLMIMIMKCGNNV